MEMEREGTNGMREPRRAKGIERDSTMRHGTDNNSLSLSILETTD